jgi:hypothetical protein
MVTMKKTENVGKYKVSVLLTGSEGTDDRIRPFRRHAGEDKMTFMNWVVLPGVVGKESIVFIIVILVAAFAISTLLDMRKKKKGK